MSIHNQSTSMIRFSVVFLLFVFFSSCTEEIVEPQVYDEKSSHLSISDFPSEITLNNWESFVHAPADVLDFHRKQELLLQAVSISKPTDKLSGLEKNNHLFMVKGFIKAYSGSWISIANVRVSMGHQITLSSQDPSNRGYNYLLGAEAKGPLCMYLETEPTNGMTPLDMVLIKKHMTGQTPLENVWQLLAADVNNDGDINDVDLHHIQEVLLEREEQLPETDNVFFVGKDDLERAQTLLLNGNLDGDLLAQLGRTSPCQEGAIDRYMIKAGDVNGTANF